MFTGLVEETGRIERLEERPGGRRLRVAASRVLEGTRAGDSLALNGCCLTAIEVTPAGFAVDTVPETLARTTIGAWRAGQRINLERAMRFDQRLGGHLVQGHVDGVGEVADVKPEGEGRRVAIELPAMLRRFVAEKGSLAVDGISLTVAGVQGARCEVALIPHTLGVTVAGDWKAGTKVHLEVDLIARYVARLLEESGAGKDGRT
jgi:riboflavin synthase